MLFMVGGLAPHQFFFLNVQIYMKDAEHAESKEKSNFRFSFFKLWWFLWRHHPNFQCIFHDNLKNKKSKNFLIIFFILFSTLRIIHENRIKTEKGGDLHVVSWEIPFCLVHNRGRGDWQYDHIPPDLEIIRNLFLWVLGTAVLVYLTYSQRYFVIDSD